MILSVGKAWRIWGKSRLAALRSQSFFSAPS
jgi:hypothetical protein